RSCCSARVRAGVFAPALLALSCLALVAAPSALAAECPNEVIRREQHVAGLLADCRAFEEVSPQEKGGGDVVADGVTSISSSDGNGVVYHSRSPFGDEVGAQQDGHVVYLARRSASGWTTHSVTPLPRADASQVVFAATDVNLFSDDLTTAVTWGYDLPGGNGVPERRGIWVENTASRALESVTGAPEGELSPFAFFETEVYGISADARHLAFVST